jgi:acetyl-CoA carboxylase biotin carboxyl carrier protein
MTAELTFAEVGEIIALLQRVEGSDVVLEWGDLRIEVRRASHSAPRSTAAEPAEPVVAEQSTEQIAQPTPEPIPQTPPEESETPDHWVPLTAPMVGTFYRSPKPGEPPFAEVGDVVEKGSTVALIEVMKLFTELEAEVGGTVVRVDAADAALVDFGQNLLWVDPS